MSDEQDGQGETNVVRLSFRTSQTRYQKIVDVAQRLGLLNAKGKPNVSAVLNYIIDRFEAPKTKGRRKRRG